MAQQQIVIKKTSNKWSILSIIVGLCIVAAAPCGLIWQGLNSHYDPVEYPLSLTKSLLDAASQPVNAVPPTSLPGDVRHVDNRCWTFLKTALAKNNNQYRMEARLYGDYGTPDPSDMTGSDEVVINVLFMDGTKAELYYYISYLESCRELKPDDRLLFSTPIIESTSVQ
jgi:hypothetical protein